MLTLFAFILTLVLVVGLHEAGHAWAARWFGVKIQKISIGFGKTLIQWRHWAWNLWPLGGSVLLLNSRITPVAPKDLPYCFDRQSVSKRIIILLAGAGANLLTAWLALVLVFYVGLTYRLPQIKSVVVNSPAALAGISAQDQFLAVNGRATPSWQQVGTELILAWGKKEVDLSLRQSSTQEIKQVTIDLSQTQGLVKAKSLLAIIGIEPNKKAPEGIIRAASLLEAIHNAVATINHTIYFFLVIIQRVLTGSFPFSLLQGPIGLLAITIRSWTQGGIIFLFFIAHLSLAVGLVNLLPIPGLDGGSIVYSLIEAVRKKPISIALEVLLHRLALIAVCLLLVQLVLNDLR